jgi:hypothetical protein
VAHAAPHAVMLRGLAAGRGQGPLAPTLVARTEDEFIAAVQAVLAEPAGAQRLADAMAALPRDDAGRLLLYPPVQRVHQLVLVEACCAEPGHPRLDPRRIASAGMVLRRPQSNAETGPHGAGWMAWQRRGEQAIGWVPLAARGGAHGVGELDEPDAARRGPLHSSGNAHIDARLQQLSRQRALQPLAAMPPSERTVPLHPLPEALCAALQRTLLVGYLPVASDEVVAGDEPARGPVGDEDAAALQPHFMHYLRGGGLKPLPRAGEAVDASWLEEQGGADGGSEDAGAPTAGRWVQALMQLHLEFDLAGSDSAALALQQAFGAYRVLRLGAAGRQAVSRLSEALTDTWMAELCDAPAEWSPRSWHQSLQDEARVPPLAAWLAARLYRRWQEADAPLADAALQPLGAWEEAALPVLRTLLVQQPDADTLARLAGLDPIAFGAGGAGNAAALYQAALQQALALHELRQTQALRCIVRFLGQAAVEPALPAVAAQIAALVGDTAEAPTQPGWWAPVSDAAALAFARAAAERVRQREAAMFSGRGKRLSEPGVPLAVRCFVRLKPEAEGCAGALAWSGSSELFTVAPWWQSGPAKPRVVDLPDPFDRAVLRRLRPSVGFAMSGRLGALMTPARLDKLKDGKKPGDSGPGLGIDWICGFNIPIITICAFIVLNIFLQLLNIVFWWLPFVKICLPVPAKKD